MRLAVKPGLANLPRENEEPLLEECIDAMGLWDEGLLLKNERDPDFRYLVEKAPSFGDRPLMAAYIKEAYFDKERTELEQWLQCSLDAPGTLR